LANFRYAETLSDILSHFFMEDFQKFTLKEYQYWDIQLHSNQCHLGRCVLWYKQDGVVDLFDASPEAREELWKIADHLKRVLTKLFQPDLFNYSALSNVTNHLHIHVIPRYKDERIFENHTFTDVKFGSNPYPYDKSFTLPEDVLNKIKDTIKEAL